MSGFGSVKIGLRVVAHQKSAATRGRRYRTKCRNLCGCRTRLPRCGRCRIELLSPPTGLTRRLERSRFQQPSGHKYAAKHGEGQETTRRGRVAGGSGTGGCDMQRGGRKSASILSFASFFKT